MKALGLPWRRGRVVGVLVPLALILAATPASAEHWDDDTTTGRFEPQFTAATEIPIIDSNAGLTLRVTQQDKETVARRYTVAIAPGWRFAAASIDRSDLPNCRAATDKDDLARKAEHVAFVRVVVATDPTRDDTPRVNSSRRVETTSPGPAIYEGDLWLLDWNETASEARLCGFVETSSTRVPISRKTVVFQAALRLMLDASWRFSWDLAAVPGAPAGERSIIDNTTFQQENVSILESQIRLDALTPGNFNRDSDGTRTRVAFSRTPSTAGYYEVRGIFTPCGTADASSCKSAAAPRELVVTLLISHAPTRASHGSGLLTGPTAQNLPDGFGLVIGTQDVDVEWAQPSDLFDNPVDRVKGYVLVIAEPGDQESRRFEYLVTDPDLPGFDARAPCGESGIESTCTLRLSFPMTSAEGRDLSGDGVYNLALVTVYEDGHRTDGLCDDLTGQGARCAARVAGFNVGSPEISTWQLVARQQAWPNIFVMTRGERLIYLLFVDFAAHAAEYFILNRIGGNGTSYRALTNTIQGIGDVGAFEFSNALLFSPGQTFRFDGVAAGRVALGVFTLYDLKNPGPRGTSGTPSASTDLFQGTRVQ